MTVLATYNIKGGVGKTATAVNLAHLAASDGRRALVWDLDPQGAATFCFRIKPRVKGGGKKLLRGAKRRLERRVRGTDFAGLDLLPADFSYRHLDLALDAKKKPTRRLARLLEPLAGHYRYVFLDCAPSISLTSESIFAASDLLLVPTIPTPLSVRTLVQLDRHLHREGPPGLRALPFLCMVDRRKTLHRSGEELIRASGHDYRRTDPPLATPIPYASLVERMGVERMPVAAFAPTSAPARAYAELWREIVGRVG